MNEHDDLLEKAVSKIRDQELKILDDFAKAYLAAEFLSGHDLAWCVKNIQLNQQKVNEGEKFGYKYWYSLKEEHVKNGC